MYKWILSLHLILLSGFSSVNADIVTYRFSGILEQTPIIGTQSGDDFHVDVTLDTSVSPVLCGYLVGSDECFYEGSILNMQGSIGNVDFSFIDAATNTGIEIWTANGYYGSDYFNIGYGNLGLYNPAQASIGGYDVFDSFISLSAISGALVDSTLTNDLRAFNTSDIYYRSFTVNFDGHISLRGDIDSISVVPLPASIWLLGSGLIGLTCLARRRQANS